MIDLVLKKSKERSLLRRHPWSTTRRFKRWFLIPRRLLPQAARLFASSLSTAVFLAWAATFAQLIRARCWSFKEEEVIDVFSCSRRSFVTPSRLAPACVTARSARASRFRRGGGRTSRDRRPCHCLVTQFQLPASQAHRELIADLLMQITGAKTIFDRSDVATRQREGLPIRSQVPAWRRAPPAAIEVVEDGVGHGVDVRVGHKTGFYVDQRESRLTAQGRRGGVPPLSPQGHARAQLLLLYGRLLSCTPHGAAKSSPSTLLRRPLTWPPPMPDAMVLQGDCAKFVCKDSSCYLRELRDAGRKFHLVILDPPKVRLEPSPCRRVARAYKDINLNGLKLLCWRPALHVLVLGAVDVDLFPEDRCGRRF